MIVYHGSTTIVEHPIADFGRDSLDFGKGFYVTTIKQQAEKWAVQVADRKRQGQPTLNTYRLDEIPATYNKLKFEAYDRDWLEFIVANRKGLNKWKDYDIIEGGIANDRVLDTIEIYLAGLITIDEAIGRLRYQKVNSQICIINQEIINNCLHFIQCDSL